MNGLRSAAAGMAAQQQWLDALANDVANVNTTGYRRQRVAFRDLAYSDDRGVPVGAGAAATSAGISAVTGQILPSESPLALAIEGPGFFQVRRADGSLALTRAGDFRLDGEGTLVTASGEGLEPPVKLPAGTSPSQIAIAPDGKVTVDATEVGTITLVDVPAPSALLALGAGLYAVTEGSGAATEVASPTVRQGALESANVDLGEAMLEVLQAQRAFELIGRAFRTQADLLEIVNGIRR